MKAYKRNLFTIGLVLIASEIAKQYTLTFQLNQGQYNFWYLPFQLCSIPMYVCLILPFVSGERAESALLSFLADFGLLGGILSFADVSGMHYPLPVLTIHSYLWHIALILIGIYAGRILTGGTKKETTAWAHSLFFTSFIGAALLYLACCCIATALNVGLHAKGTINMFYISPLYPMNQVVFRSFTPYLGNNGTILLYICATIAGAFFIHALRAAITKGTQR